MFHLKYELIFVISTGGKRFLYNSNIMHDIYLYNVYVNMYKRTIYIREIDLPIKLLLKIVPSELYRFLGFAETIAPNPLQLVYLMRDDIFID